MEFDKVKSFLSKQVDDNGTSIYSHIAAISRKIVDEKLENAYDQFENLSLAVKESKLRVSGGNDMPKIVVDEQERQQIQSNIDAILTAYGRKPEKKAKAAGVGDEEEEDDEEEKEEEEESVDLKKCANILEHLQLLSWSGLCFENEEAIQLQHAFVRLVRTLGENIDHSRFWGKIQAMNSEYWIVEVKLAEYPEAAEDQPPKHEDPGKGANEFVYFVTTNIENGEWVRLKDVTPEQIKKSRQIHRLFTGDLSARVSGRVHFQWTEAELLRAQIARISASTVLAPTDYYQKPEEEDEENPFTVELNEEFAANEEGGGSQDAWVHSRGHLRLEGRLFKWVQPEKEDEDEDDGDGAEQEEKEPTPEELEEEIPILQSIGSDQCSEFSNGGDDEESEASNVWSIRTLNERIGYKVVVIANKLWSGAKTVYLSNSNQFVNIYVGNGIKYRPTYYTPTPPAAIQEEFNEFTKEVEVANPAKEQDEDAEDTITKMESIFDVQEEVMPPPPKAENEENEEEEADKEEEE